MQTHPLSAERVFTLISNLQHGSASRPQLEANGVSPDTIDRRLKNGLWIHVAPAVFRSASRPPDWKMRASAALLEGHSDAVIGGRTALGLFGLEAAVIRTDPPRLLVEHRKTHESAIASVRQVNGWPETELYEFPISIPPNVCEVLAIRCTTVARSLIDIGCWSTPRNFHEFTKLADEAVRRKLVTYESIAESAEIAKELRRRNVVAVQRWVAGCLTMGVDGTALERLGQRMFHRWGVSNLVQFEVPHPAYPQSDKRADAICNSTQVIFEYDSRKWHLSEQGFQNDRERDGMSAENGWTTLRITWNDLTNDRAKTRARVRRLCGLDGGVIRAA
jgi:hypothetical protein